jgi:hypothetical protein
LTIALQYLEDGPEVATISVEAARVRLRAAFDLLPIAYVLIGWNLPTPLVQACREETHRHGARFYRWHPLLTGDGTFVPRPEWQTIGLAGEPVPGFQHMPEFTFVCPNKPAVRSAVLDHLRQLIEQGGYDGFFLDRMRFPSPAADPSRWLACFCADCQRVAAVQGFDLLAAQQAIQRWLATPQGLLPFLTALFRGTLDPQSAPDLAPLQAFLDFRAQSITNFIQSCAERIHEAGLDVGLDAFSPTLTRMVGQNLASLAPCADWTKVMTYCHALGPAGLPFELLDLANWLVDQCGVSETQALTWLTQASGLPLPRQRTALRSEGLPSAALITEMRRGQAAQVKNLLAGIELVEIDGVAQLSLPQIERDLQALQSIGIYGLVISWDLWHIPNERLALVRDLGFRDENSVVC